MADEIKTQFQLIEVLAIDEDKLSKEIDKQIKKEIKKAGKSEFAPKLEENEYFSVRRFAIATSKTGKQFYTDYECVHDSVEDGKIRLDVYSEKRDEKGQRIEFGVFPCFTSTMDIKDITKKKYATKVSMFEFMKSRFRYNPRIESNMRIFVKSMGE